MYTYILVNYYITFRVRVVIPLLLVLLVLLVWFIWLSEMFSRIVFAYLTCECAEDNVHFDRRAFVFHADNKKNDIQLY